jgi:hypothetical protein
VLAVLFAVSIDLSLLLMLRGDPGRIANLPMEKRVTLARACLAFLNLTLEDDTGSIKAKVGRFDYKKWGDPIIQKAKMGEWFLWKGSLRDDGWRVVNVDRWRALDETSALYKAPPQQGG